MPIRESVKSGKPHSDPLSIRIPSAVRRGAPARANNPDAMFPEFAQSTYEAAAILDTGTVVPSNTLRREDKKQE